MSDDGKLPLEDPLRHIVRPSLPWRDADLTRCGRPIAELVPAAVVTFDQARAIVDKHGKRRAAFLLCMTCADGVAPWPEWVDDPCRLLGRYLEGARRHRSVRTAAGRELEVDLRALELLVDEHRDEFDATRAALASATVVDLTERRAARRRR